MSAYVLDRPEPAVLDAIAATLDCLGGPDCSALFRDPRFRPLLEEAVSDGLAASRRPVEIEIREIKGGA